MALSPPPAFAYRAKALDVVDHHYDDQRPGKPLLLLIPGGAIALGALALVLAVVYGTWGSGTLEPGAGAALLALLSPVYVAGVFLFSYGYELYDLKKALKLTAIIVMVTVAAVVILAVLLVVLKAMSGGSRSSSRSSSSSSSSSGGGGGGRGSSSDGGFRHYDLHFGGGSAAPAPPSSPSPADAAAGAAAGAALAAPKPYECPYCRRLYLPEETQYVCPGCGASDGTARVKGLSGE